MPGAQVTTCDYVPKGRPASTRCVVRRVRVPASEVRSDTRSRRRRTIPAEQLALALSGDADQTWAYSFILTNPDGTAVNRAWRCSAYLTLNLSAFTQSLGGSDTTGRRHAKRARRELFRLPARVLTHARSLLVRIAPAARTSTFDTTWDNLRALPTTRAG